MNETTPKKEVTSKERKKKRERELAVAELQIFEVAPPMLSIGWLLCVARSRFTEVRSGALKIA